MVSPPPAPGALGPVGPAGATAPSFDLGEVMRRARLSYRQDGDAWSGGGDTYAVRASADGFEVTPVNHGAAPRRGAPARFSTKRITRGPRPLGAAGNPRVEPDGHLAVDRGEAVEHLHNTDEGVALSYSFHQRPRGAGDLTVQLSVTGHVHAGETAQGHHYVDPSTGLGVRFGRATWIDAAGARTAVPVLAQGGEIELRVPASVIDGSMYPAVLDPVVSPEMGMDAPLMGPTRGDQTKPAIAFGGGQYLVTWHDIQNGWESHGVRGARVGLDGAVLDPVGFPILEDVYTAAVAFDGTSYLVVAETGNEKDSESRVVGARVSLDGAVLDPGGFLVSVGSMNAWAPAVTFDGANHMVTWNEVDSSSWSLYSAIYSARVTPAGVVLDPDGILTASDATSRPGITFDGTSSVVAYFLDDEVRVARISPQGDVLDPAGIVAGSGATSWTWQRPAVVFDGTNTTVAWSTHGGPDPSTVHAARVSPQGDALDPAGILVATSTADTKFSLVAAAFDGTSTVIAWIVNPADWTTPESLISARLSPQGDVLDPIGIFVAESSYVMSPAIAGSGGGCFLVWICVDDEQDIHGARMSSEGVVLDPQGIIVSATANTQTSPKIAFDGENYLVVWADRRGFGAGDTSVDVYGARITPSGRVLDPAAIVIAAGAWWQTMPLAVFDGVNTLVLWLAYPGPGEVLDGQVFGARVTPQGDVLDFVPIALPIDLDSEYSVPFGAASSGTRTLVVRDYSTEAVLVSQDGAVSEIAPIAEAGRDPAVASDGSSYLVVWVDDEQLQGARLDEDGVSLDPDGFTIASLGSGYDGRPAVSFDGVNYLVVWRSLTAGDGYSYDVYGARVSPAGALLDPQPILIDAGTIDIWHVDTAQPAVAFNGKSFIVAWNEPTIANDATSFDLHGAEVSREGAILAKFPISEEPGSEGPPALASKGDLGAVVAYARFHDEPPFGAWRVHSRLVSVEGCGDPSHCDSGFCVDGVCCDTACGGGDPTDCQACSVAAGSAENGTCAPLTGSACGDDGVCVEGVCTPPEGAGGAGGQGAGGAGGQGAGAAPPPDPILIDGCGCRMAGAPPPAGPLLLFALGGLLAGRRAARGHARRGSARPR